MREADFGAIDSAIAGRLNERKELRIARIEDDTVDNGLSIR